ncbi:MAG TPA: VOC family protein [Fimbriimonas sp.]|nr:VOC family protein [Fimbriimonas sp.]
MNPGRLDVCPRVSNVATSRAFYEDLGFQRVEGDDAQGWAVMANGEARLGLFEKQFMKTEPSLNFRGGKIGEIVQNLTDKGRNFVSAKPNPDGTGSAELRDPDNHLIFFDTSKEELS